MELLVFFIIVFLSLVIGFITGVGWHEKRVQKVLKERNNAKDLMNSRLKHQKNQYKNDRRKLKNNIASYANEMDRDLRGIFKILNNM